MLGARWGLVFCFLFRVYLGYWVYRVYRAVLTSLKTLNPQP